MGDLGKIRRMFCLLLSFVMMGVSLLGTHMNVEAKESAETTECHPSNYTELQPSD